MGSVDFQLVLLGEVEEDFLAQLKVDVKSDEVVAELAQQVEDDVLCEALGDGLLLGLVLVLVFVVEGLLAYGAVSLASESLASAPDALSHALDAEAGGEPGLLAFVLLLTEGLGLMDGLHELLVDTLLNAADPDLLFLPDCVCRQGGREQQLFLFGLVLVEDKLRGPDYGVKRLVVLVTLVDEDSQQVGENLGETLHAGLVGDPLRSLDLPQEHRHDLPVTLYRQLLHYLVLFFLLQVLTPHKLLQLDYQLGSLRFLFLGFGRVGLEFCLF